MASRHLHIAIALLLSACGGWRRPDTYFARGRAQEATYAFGVPSDAWTPLRKPRVAGVQVAWVQPELAGVIEILGQCDAQGDSSLQQYTDHLRIDWTDWKLLEQTEEEVIGRAALRTRVEGRLDGVPRINEFVVVKKNGCLFDVRYSARPGSFERGYGDFNRVLAGFRFPIGSK